MCGDNESGNITVICKNSILWGNNPHDTAKIKSKTSVTYRISDCCVGIEFGGFINEGGNINIDPIFLAPSVQDYHLSPTSPLIDQGKNMGYTSYDIDGDLRDTLPDIGADEYVDVSDVGKINTEHGVIFFYKFSGDLENPTL